MLTSDIHNRSRWTMLRAFLTIAVGALLILCLLAGGEFVQRLVAYQEGWGSSAPVAAARHIILNLFHKVPHPLDDARLENAGLPVYELRIQRDELRSLRQTADQVVAARISSAIPSDYVPAQFLLEGQWLDIEVKLRGKTSAHYSRYRPSLRLKFPDDRLFGGKRMINLLRAHDKGVTMDLTTNWELARHGIVTWESQFVVLKVNGEVIGVFQEIEQFGRSMLDRAGRSEGFIFSGAGQLYGKEEAFGWDKAEPAMRWFLACKDQGRIPPDAGSCTWSHMQEYLDTDKFAWAAAQATLLGSAHAWSSDNTRVYYDPARGKFEPIPWDFKGYLIDPATSPEGETCKFHGTAFLRVPEFRRMRDQRLWVLMTSRLQPMLDHANELFAELRDVFPLDHRSPKYWREQQVHESFLTLLRRNTEYLTGLFQRHDLRAKVCGKDQAGFLVELENCGKAFVTVTGVVLRQGEELTCVTLDEPQLVDGVWMGEPGRALLDLAQHASDPRLLAGNVELVGLIAQNNITGATLADKEIQIVSAQPANRPSFPEQRPTAPEPLELPANVRLAGSELLCI